MSTDQQEVSAQRAADVWAVIEDRMSMENIGPNQTVPMRTLFAWAQHAGVLHNNEIQAAINWAAAQGFVTIGEPVHPQMVSITDAGYQRIR